MPFRWRASPAVSALHAAHTLLDTGQLTDRRLADVVQEPADALQRAVDTLQLPSDAVWRHLIGRRADARDARQCVVRVVDSLTRPASIAPASTTPASITQGAVELVVDAMSRVESAVERAFPSLGDELQLRAGPLRQLWEARGPGMMRALVRGIDESARIPDADVVLVQPARGGDGCCYPPGNLVVIEGVLANPHDELPEVVRLGWLIAQLMFDADDTTRGDQRETTSPVARLALIAAALESAEYVELARFDESTVVRALDAWHVETDDPTTLARVLTTWWRGFRDDRIAWPEALEQLRARIN